MRILSFDSVGGASGDMVLGALIELGVDAADIEHELVKLDIEPFHIVADPFESHGLHGTQVEVQVETHGHTHGGRRFADIRAMIEGGDLSEGAKAKCIEVFGNLAKAEASIHGMAVDDVHFHEVGALDSIIDIVGACIALDMLEIDEVVVGPLPLGQGTVTCRHGTYPVPAPATVRLLEGHPVVQTDESKELVTPTGAALLTTWRSRERIPAGARILKSGYAFGHHELSGRPNLLRAVLLETTADRTGDTCVVLDANIDDTTPELLGALMGRLLEDGALDAFTTPVQMKKQRPGTLLTILCRPEDRERMLDLVFTETTTFGVREYETARTKLNRRSESVETPYGEIRVKIGTWKGRDVTFAPEMDDCVKKAESKGVPVRRVYEAAARSART